MARVEDVTGRLIRDAIGPGDRVKRVQQTRPAPNMRLTPALAAFLEKWRTPSDKTIGFISNALAYSDTVAGPTKTYHTNMIKLIKSGAVNVCEVHAPPPPGSRAYRESRYGDRFYFLKAGVCPVEIEPEAATFTGARRRR